MGEGEGGGVEREVLLNIKFQRKSPTLFDSQQNRFYNNILTNRSANFDIIIKRHYLEWMKKPINEIFLPSFNLSMVPAPVVEHTPD